MLSADFEVRRREFPVRARVELQFGERLALLGPSGAGKTTVLSALSGLVELSAGQVVVDGTAVGTSGSRPRPGAGGVRLVGPTTALFPHLTIRQNLTYRPGVDSGRAEDLARRLGIDRLLDARPRSLSEGQRHRAVLARSLVSGCRVLCLDEPFSALDRPLAEELMGLVLAEIGDLVGAAVLVTHNLGEAQTFADTLGVLHDGHLLQMGPGREMLTAPASAEVARLMGYRGWLRAGRRLLAVHPEMWSAPGQDGVRLRGTVESCRPLGARFDLGIEAQGEWSGRLHLHRDLPAAPGEAIAISVPSLTFPDPDPDG